MIFLVGMLYVYYRLYSALLATMFLFVLSFCVYVVVVLWVVMYYFIFNMKHKSV